jgi:putative transposase
MIAYEDLRVPHLLKHHHLAKSSSDAGWSAFVRMLAFKAAGAGKRVRALDPAYTS